MSHERTSAAQDFFLNLGVVATLYTVVISFLSLVFSVVNRLFPDAVAYYSDPYSSGVRFAMASLIIVFPLFVWLSRIVTKAIMHDASRKDSAIRRWMVYVTLFLASVTLVVDLVVLLNSFLSGDITTRFILKALSVLVVAGLVFWHYLGEIRGTNSYKKYIVTVSVSGVLVLAALVASFVVFGSPASVRQARLDDQRVSDLQSIQWQVLSYYQSKGQVPADLTYPNDSISSYMTPKDPVTGTDYSYAKTGARTFTLCADFAAAADGKTNLYGTDTSYAYPVGTKGTAISTTWQHAAGKACFDRSIDPDFYPLNSTRS